jgi:hypothetical protein
MRRNFLRYVHYLTIRPLFDEYANSGHIGSRGKGISVHSGAP